MAARKKRTTKKAETAEARIVYEGRSLTESPVIYANHTELSISSVDVQIRLNRAISRDDDGVLHVLNQATVVMSREYARAFVELLAKNADHLQAHSEGADGGSESEG